MKRVYILACLVVASMAFVSCTNDEEDTTSDKTKIPMYADDPDIGGGQSGQTPIPPPKP